MKINVGIWDRIGRMILAIVFFVVGSLYVDGYSRLTLYVLSLVMVVTSTSGYCYLYKVCKINTTSGKK